MSSSKIKRSFGCCPSSSRSWRPSTFSGPSAERRSRRDWNEYWSSWAAQEPSLRPASEPGGLLIIILFFKTWGAAITGARGGAEADARGEGGLGLSVTERVPIRPLVVRGGIALLFPVPGEGGEIQGERECAPSPQASPAGGEGGWWESGRGEGQATAPRGGGRTGWAAVPAPRSGGRLIGGGSGGAGQCGWGGDKPRR